MSQEEEGGAPLDTLIAAVGAVLFASGEPVQPAEIVRAFASADEGQVEEAIRCLERYYADNRAGLRLERVAGGIRLATRPEVAEWVRQFFRERNRARLSPAALETLAIVAYRQPVTLPEIQAIRGKDPTAALRGLIDKKLVRTLGKKKVVGSPLLYGTSTHFLVHFGLDSLEDLPSMEEFDTFVDAFAETAEAVRPEGEKVAVAAEDESGA